MDKKRWETIHQIVDTLLTLPEDKKEDFLKTTCGDDEELIKEVKEYLDHIYESEKSGFLSDLAGENSDLFHDLSDQKNASKTDDSHSLVGKKVGNYQIAKLIDEGGMGQVFLGERVDGEFDQKVAIKFLNQRNLSKDIRLRFSQEKKILGNLKHPNIAMLLDGGVLDNGSPYLIMEYIDGTPIDEYCNENKLNVNERLILFKEVLKAIDYAHSNLVVHRDLKPSNILINKNGQVKILDFGIAKLMQDDSAADIKLTKQGQRLWTPQFAAPEQILEKPPLIQTDIYALGTLLHLLLTNDTPFDLSDKSLHEVEKVILNDSPTNLLKSLSNVKEKEIQNVFGISKTSLENSLKRDLEAIVLKAMRKEPEDRYSNAQAFIDDIINFQNNFPVLATKGNIGYRVTKYLKRNNKYISAVSIIFLLIAGIIGFYTYHLNLERKVAETEAETASIVTNFMIDLFESSDPIQNIDTLTNVKDILKLGTIKIQNQEINPETKIRLLTAIGDANKKIGDFNTSETLLLQADSLSNIHFNKFDFLPAYTAMKLSSFYKLNNAYENIETFAERALPYYKKNESKYPRDYARIMENIGFAYLRTGRVDSALIYLSESLETVKTYLPNENTFTIRNSIGLAYHAKGDLQNAEQEFNQVIQELGEIDNEEYNIYMTALNGLTVVHYANSDYSKAEKSISRTLEVIKHVYGKNHPNYIVALGNLLSVYNALKDKSSISSLADEYIELNVSVYGKDSWRVGSAHRAVGSYFFQNGIYKEALYQLENSVNNFRISLNPDHKWTLITQFYYAFALINNNKAEEGLSLYSQTLYSSKKKNNFNYTELKQLEHILNNADIYSKVDIKHLTNQVRSEILPNTGSSD